MDDDTNLASNDSATPAALEATMGIDNGAFRMRLISHHVYNQLVLLWPILWLFILPPGLLANALNLRTFFRMGLNDSVTISFFTLAVTDFAQLFFPLVSIVAMTLVYLEKNFSIVVKVQPLAVFIYATNAAVLFNTWTCLITAFLSVQRCLCIFMPFHFRSIFTKFRTWTTMAAFGVYSALPAGAYPFITYDMMHLSLPTNKSQLVIIFKSSFRAVQKYADLIFMTTSVTCQVLSLGSLIFMAIALAASVRFRKSATASTSATDNQKQARVVKTEDKGKSQSIGQGDEEKSSTKERTAIIQVALLAAIYLVTSVPRIAFSIGSFSVTEFGLNRKENNLYLFGFISRVTFDYVNSAVNFFVYYKYNSRFRKLCFGPYGKKPSV